MTAATLLPLGYSFAAGMIATVNPCGVLMLPALVAYHVTSGALAPVSTVRRAWRAAGLGVMATFGFVAVFTLVGGVVGVSGGFVTALFPIAGLAVGLALTLLGGWIALSGRSFGVLGAGRALQGARLDDLKSLFSFGVAYAVASLACTLPVFLVVTGSALATGGLGNAVLQFVAYALGMGAVFTLVSLLSALSQQTVRSNLRRIVPYVEGVAAAFLIGAGIFVTFYWLAYWNV